MREKDAVTACCRFGLGPRPGDLKKFAGDPRGAALAELHDPRAAIIPSSDQLPDSAAAFRLFREFQERKREEDRMKSEGMELEGLINPRARIFQAEAHARFQKELLAPVGVAERLVLFWSNHFSIAASKGNPVHVMAGAFEREAIRPHVLGRFRDMLRAVERHPAMLFYLDNQISIGPNSPRGGGGKRGLNENLAREILELHTLGVDGGYAQDDVTSLARILTGWTFVPPVEERGGEFRFTPEAHEPGAHKLLDRVFTEGGVEQGEAALDFLGIHPSTARHIARKLAAHFVGENPPAALTARLEKTFLSTGGHLGAVTRELLAADEAWNAPAKKLRSPVEFVVATERVVAKPELSKALIAALSAMGQPLWNPPSPKGFPDTNASWAAPASIKARLEFSAKLAASAAERDPKELLEEAFAMTASRDTRNAVRRAESKAQGIALLLMSPEFQRR